MEQCSNKQKTSIQTLVFCFFISFWGISTQAETSLPVSDRIRLAEVFRIAKKFQDKVWENWSRAPFAVLLVTSQREYLVRHPGPSEDFGVPIYDSILTAGIYSRPPRFAPNLLATFPAVKGVPTIVVGQPKNVSKSSAEWVLTLLHEHFHQLQMSQPNYFAAVESLGLSGGDQTGRWMLDYPFPYDSSAVNEAFTGLGRMLSKMLKAKKGEMSQKLPAYLEARKRFQNLLSANDYKYFSFQCWQEGAARYTELRVAKLLADNYQPSDRFRMLLDFTTFKSVADSIEKEILSTLTELSLPKQRRVAFYYFGAAEAMLLDKTVPAWQKNYFKLKFSLDKHFSSL
jgi:hypothetical protein